MRRALLILVITACSTGGETLVPLRPRLVADQERVQLGPTQSGVLVEARATFSNPSDGEAHLQAFLDGHEPALELLDTQGTATRDHPAQVRIRFLPTEPGTITTTLVIQHDAEPTSDGSRTLRVTITAIAEEPPRCDDGNPCTADLSDVNAPGGCAFLPIHAACDDGDACTSGDMCSAGRCVGAPRSCDDGIACTADACESSTGECTHAPVAAACADEDPCSLDACDAAAGCTHATAPGGTPCSESSCTEIGLCVAGTCVRSPTPDGFPCDDGNACTAGDTCEAGVCIPGASIGLSPPVRIHEPAGVLSVGGHFPLDVDAVLLESDPPPAEALRSVVLWRGVDEEALSSPCTPGSASCLDGPECGDAVARRRWLHLTWVKPDGRVLAGVVLDPDAVHDAALATLGGVPGAFPTPPGSATVARAVTSHDGVWGAAMVSFGRTCGCLPPPPPPPMGSSGVAEVPVSACTLAGDSVTVFHLDVMGVLQLVDVHWLGPQPLLQSAGETTAHGPDRRRLLDVAWMLDRFTVSWLAETEPMACDETCPPDRHIDTRIYERSGSSLALQSTLRTPYPVDGVPRVLRTRMVQGELVATVLHAIAPDIPACEGPVLADAWVVPLRGSAMSEAVQLDHNVLDAVMTSRDLVSMRTLSFTQDAEQLAGSCQYVDEFRDASGTINLTQQRTTDGVGAAWNAAVDLVEGTALSADLALDDTVRVLASRSQDVAVVGERLLGASGTGVARDVPPILGTLGSLPAVAAIESGPSSPGGLQQPGIVMTTVLCIPE